MARRSTWLGATTILLGSLFATPSGAAPTPADRQAALKLGGEALDLFEAGDYASALEKFEDADKLLPAPTLKLRIARCLDKLDRMHEAAEVYREVIATELSATAPAVHREARKQAVPELAEVLDAMPSVSVIVEGPGASDASIEMNGQPVAADEMGDKKTVDPGHYRFQATGDGRTVVEEIDVDRNKHERVVLTFPKRDGDPPDTISAENDGSALRIAGWASIAVGGAGFSLASIMGVVVLSEEQDLLDACPDRRCPTAVHDDARAFDTKRIVTTAGFIVGGVGVAAGVTMLLLAPSGSSEEMASVRPMLGPGFVGMEGSF